MLDLPTGKHLTTYNGLLQGPAMPTVRLAAICGSVYSATHHEQQKVQ